MQSQDTSSAVIRSIGWRGRLSSLRQSLASILADASRLPKHVRHSDVQGSLQNCASDAMQEQARSSPHRKRRVGQIPNTTRKWLGFAAVVQQSAAALRRMGAKCVFVGLGAPAGPVRDDEIAVFIVGQMGEE